MKLPEFKYHPDPVATGSVVASDLECECCGQARGYIYTGPVYAEEEFQSAFCPWCICDGTASQKFDATFTDEDGIGALGHWESVPDQVVTQVARRTPGFAGWQQERWWTHCGDAAAFIGRVGYEELRSRGPEAIAAYKNLPVL
jgi:uncharacterized protein CbrC (UPF0167 family)